MVIRQVSEAEVVRAEFFEALVDEDVCPIGSTTDRRVHRRYPLSVVAMATPLDEHMRPVDEPFPVLTRDISQAGIGLVHSKPLDRKYVTLDLTGPQGHHLHVTIEVLRCNQFLCGSQQNTQYALDDPCTYYESGGRFVENRLDMRKS